MAEWTTLSDEDFRRLCDYLYRRTGMVFDEPKRFYVERRMEERMIATGIGSFAGYFAHLRADVDGEVEQFINAFTVNETYFYREDDQLRCLTDDLLNIRVKEKPAGEPIRIWSMPCSTGEEPYSIAIWLLEHWPLVDQYEIEIVGSDIDTRVLEDARAGVFGKRALMRLSDALVQKYFTEAGADSWRILDDLRSSVHFTPANVLDRNETLRQGRFDVIFCRNVLIYFDDASRRVAAENLYENLTPGGFICLGHTESMSRITPIFDVCRFANAVVYRRPNGGANGGANA